MTPEERLGQLDQALEALRTAWPTVLPTLHERADELTVSLIGENDEQTRGRIKELMKLIELPQALKSERDSIVEALQEQGRAE
jgi:hypothetical protein